MSATPQMILNAISSVLLEEGGWVNNPDDRGGPTNRGVTLTQYSVYLGRPATVAELQAMSVETATDLYSKSYVYSPGFVLIENEPVLIHIVDCGVNHGPVRPTIWMQAAFSLAQDGHFGPVSAAAINAAPQKAYRALCAARARFYGQIVRHDPTQSQFDAGWMDRLAHFIELAP